MRTAAFVGHSGLRQGHDAGSWRVPNSNSDRLPDQLRPKLRLVFVGTAASTRSAELGHYYAHPGNRFWRAIHEAGITPRRYQPSEFAALIELGIGFTDLSKSGAGMDHQIAAETIDVAGFKAKIENIGRARLRSRARRRRACFMAGRRAGFCWGGSRAMRVGRRYLCCRRRPGRRPGIGRWSRGGSWRSGSIRKVD